MDGSLKLVGEGIRNRARKFVTGSEATPLRQHLAQELKKPLRVKLIDKLSFTLGIINILATEYFLLTIPKHFWKWYMFWIFPLLGLRYYMYKKRAWQYFLIDFCYAVNFLAVLSMVVLPSNRVLFEITFVAANGPVLIAILAWRNSLVFHSLDKVTTLFIHAFPPMYTWAERWYGRFRDGAGVCSGSKALFAGFLDFSALDAETDPSAPPCSLTMTTALGWPILAYMVWQVLYLVKTELLDGDRISQDPSLLTSSRWFITARKGMLYNAALSVARATGLNGPDEHFEWSTVKGKAVFVVSQLIYTIVTMLPAKLMYESWAVHSLVLVAILANSLWNGASYYFEVFSLQYQARLQSVLDAADGAEKKAHGTHSPSKASGEATSPDSGASEPASSKAD